jgi:hypothetical protein
MKDRLLRGNLYLGLFIFTASAVLLVMDSAFMRIWFYMFAWWPFILILDSINYRRHGVSPLFRSVHTFFFMLFVSVGVWLIFELLNLRLQNWSYHGLPDETWQRWSGYFLAFASVIPALAELSELLQYYLKGKNISLFRLKNTAVFRSLCIVTGITCLALTLLWPRIFFPLVWLGFFFLLEPLNHKLGSDCLLKELAENKWNRFWSWVLAGLMAGIFWELFNFWAGSHWEYHLPYLDFARVFQMPVFGYLGFMPFALEVFALYTLLGFLYTKFLKGRTWQQVAGIGIVALLYLIIFYLIDNFSVVG